MELRINSAKLSAVRNFEKPRQNAELPAAASRQVIAAATENPTPNNPPWSSPLALSVWLASVLFIIILPNLAVFGYVFYRQLDLSDRAALIEFLSSDPTANVLQVLAIIPAHILTLIIAWVVVTRFNQFSFRQTLGWEWGGFNWWKCLLILAGIFAVAAVTNYFFPARENDFTRLLKTSQMAVFVVAFLATFFAPVVEEVVYRGILYSAFQRTFNTGVAVLFVTLLFTAVHIPQYAESPSTVFMILVLSLSITLVRVWTDNLLPCIVLHFFINGIQSTLLILEQYVPIPENFTPQTDPVSTILLRLIC